MREELDFATMVSYMRPEGSLHQRKFCNRYLKPVFGKPDSFGNYTLIVGDKPNVAFMAHHDTVHNKTGRSTVVLEGSFYTVTGDSSCLGADCTTGVYIILKMIEAGVEGVYVIHAGEEIGCIGSSGLVASRPDWLEHVNFAISFDRKGYNSVVTHQMGRRTCSEDFAHSLIQVLDMDYKTDKEGVFTDSNEYIFDIPECTNISVGYFNQHTKKESQDKFFLDILIDKLIKADWSKLVVGKKVEDAFGANWNDYSWPEYEQEPVVDDIARHMADLIRHNPMAVALILKDLGYDAYDLHDGIADYESHTRYARGFEKSGF